MAKKKKTVDELLEEALVPREEYPYEVPGNWVWVRLNYILSKLESGKRPRGGVNGIKKGIPSLGGEHLNYNGGFNFENMKYVPFDFADKMAKGIIKNKDVLIVKDGATTGKTAYVKNDFPYNKAVINEHIFLCRTSSKIESKILFYYLLSSVGQSLLLVNKKGSAQGGINRAFANNTYVPIMPLKEQQRIVDKIESLFSKIDTARELIEETREKFQDRKAAILARAFRGELTKKWREGNPDVESAEALLIKIEKERENVYLRECKVAKFKGLKKPIKQKRFEYNLHINDGNSLPKLWKYASLGDIVYSFKYGTSAKSDYLYNGMPVIRIPNINNLRINLSDMKYLKDDDIEESNKVTEGDILITRSNGSRDLVAKNAIVEEEFEGYAYASYLIRIRPLLVNSKYVLLLLNEKNTKEQFFSKAKSSAGINNINTQELATTIIPLPPLEEQKEIVRILDKLLSFESKIEELTQLEEQIELLKKSILSKAFRGELGTNDPTEESALGLLKEVIKDNGKSQE